MKSQQSASVDDSLARVTRVRKGITLLLFVSLVTSIVFLTVRLISLQGQPQDMEARSEGDYVLMLVQSALGIGALALPYILEHSFSIRMPDTFLILFFGFLYCGIYLGEVRTFYHRIPYWDTFLHTFSGAMLGALGFSLVLMLNDSKTVQVALSPGFIAIFAACFALSLGAIWEIYEYGVDALIGSDMQSTWSGAVPRVGHLALTDTIRDLIVDLAGACVMSVVGYVMMKKQPGWLHRFEFKTGPAAAVEEPSPELALSLSDELVDDSVADGSSPELVDDSVPDSAADSEALVG